MLKGAELLAKVAELAGQSKSDIARACGYVATKKDGSERILFSAYYEAIIDAKGVDLGTTEPKVVKAGRGKPLSFNVKASKTGVIPVTAGYSALIGVGDGDRVDIEHIDNALVLRKAAADAPAAPAACPAPAAEPAVVTYDNAPADAERELAPF